MSKLRIAITGATGLLGRNLLFEIIKQNLENLDSLELYVLGRRSGGTSIQQRIADIVRKDGLLYIGLDRADEILRCIHPMEMDLNKEKLRLSDDNYKKLKTNPIDFFFHIAALTDFRKTPLVAKSLYNTNVYGTKKIIELVSTLKVDELCYVGSAYSCGKISGDIKPDYIKINQEFRNPYEKTKLEAEMLVREFAKKTGCRCRIFRPSPIAGRLIESPLGAICKFDVFYSWASGFLKIKLKQLKTWKDKYRDNVSLDVRICYNEESGLNIVPADYGAKVIYQVCMAEDKNESYHIVNNQETPHKQYIPMMLKLLNVKGTSVVNRIPDKKNKLEALYYKTIGGVFTPYINSKPMLFDSSNINSLLKRKKLLCPAVDSDNFLFLMRYAIKHDFQINKG